MLSASVNFCPDQGLCPWTPNTNPQTPNTIPCQLFNSAITIGEPKK